MKSKSFLIYLLPAIALFSGQAIAQTLENGSWTCVKDKDELFFIEYRLDNKIRLNNFNIKEDSGFTAKNLMVARLSASGGNRTENNLYFDIEFAAYNGDEILFVLTAAPSFDMIGAGKTDEINGDVYVKPGTLEKATRFCLKLNADW